MSRFRMSLALLVLGALALVPALAWAAPPSSSSAQAATPTQAMMQQGTPTAAMMQEGTPTAGAMMQEGTPTAPAMMPTTGSSTATPWVPVIVVGLLAVGGGLALRRLTRHA